MTCLHSPKLSDMLAISRTPEEDSVFLWFHSVRVKLLFLWLTSKNIFSSVSVQEVKTSLVEKWSSAGPLFSPESPLIMTDKAILTLLNRTLTSATDCIRERGKQAHRESFLLKSGHLLNILNCKWVLALDSISIPSFIMLSLQVWDLQMLRSPLRVYGWTPWTQMQI